MKRFAPLLTLLAVAVLGGALFLLNVSGDPANQSADNAANASAADPSGNPAAPPAPGATTINLGDLAAQPPGEPPAVKEKVYAGRSAGDEVTVAIAVKDGRAIAYVCDGKKIESWLEGTVSGDTVSLKNKDGSVTVTGTINDKASFGEITVGSSSYQYAAEGVEGSAGLYEGRADVRGVLNRVGWIVENNGRQTGGLRIDGEPEPRPAPLLDPGNPDGVQIDGEPVDVSRPDGSADVVS